MKLNIFSMIGNLLKSMQVPDNAHKPANLYVETDRRNWSDDVAERKAYAKEHGGYWFGSRSWNALKTTHPKIQELLVEAIKHMNITVICGERNKKQQGIAFNSGRSSVQYPNSIHNPDNPVNKDGQGVRAVDIAPYPIDWNDIERFCYTMGKIILLAKQLNIPVRWGADWNRDGRMRDDKERKALRDYPHTEYRENEPVI